MGLYRLGESWYHGKHSGLGAKEPGLSGVILCQLVPL